MRSPVTRKTTDSNSVRPANLWGSGEIETRRHETRCLYGCACPKDVQVHSLPTPPFHALVEYRLVRLTFNQTKRVRVSPRVPFREYSSTVELLTLNQQVQGSNPCVPTILLPGSSVAEQVTVNHPVEGSIPSRAAIFY